MKYFILCVISIFIFLSCGEKKAKEKIKEFKPPEDGKITKEQAEKYVKASKNLMTIIKNHEKYVREFIKRNKLSEDLSELSDSVYCKKHPEIMKSWKRLQDRWKDDEIHAYENAGLSEEEFSWIGGALADTINKDMQLWIQDQLKEPSK